MAAQEKARSKQELVKKAMKMSTKQCFKRLHNLLRKFYTDFLVLKMQVRHCSSERQSRAWPEPCCLPRVVLYTSSRDHGLQPDLLIEKRAGTL